MRYIFGIHGTGVHVQVLELPKGVVSAPVPVYILFLLLRGS